MVSDKIIAAFPVLPSKKYQGNDGNWSTFEINVGTPSQVFHTLVSTSSRGIWLVDKTACNDTTDPTVAQHTNCLQQRGGVGNSGWNSGASSTWGRLGEYTLDLNEGIPVGQTFGKSPTAWLYPGSKYNQSVVVGQDNVAVAQNSESRSAIVANQSLVYAIADPAIFVSTLGIGDGVKRTETSPTPFLSMLDIFANQSLIPSKSWGYTAGASYSK